MSNLAQAMLDALAGGGVGSNLEASLQAALQSSGLVSSPVVTTRQSDLSLPTTAATWVDAETGGSAAARPLDVVIPDVKAGQWVSVTGGFTSAATTGAVLLDMWTVVGGAAVNRFGGNGSNNSSWVLQANAVVVGLGAVRSYQLQEGDIEDGSVRLRLRSYHVSGVQRVLLGGLGYYELRLEGRGPFF